MPQRVGDLTEAMSPAQVLDFYAGLGFAQEADDPFLETTLLTSNLFGAGNWTLTGALSKNGGVETSLFYIRHLRRPFKQKTPTKAGVLRCIWCRK